MIDKVLQERAERYGTFADHAKIAQSIQEIMHEMPSWRNMDYDMRQALCVIADKIARMGNGDPFYEDNWVDIIGYATLVLNRIRAIPKPEETLFTGIATSHDKAVVHSGAELLADAIAKKQKEVDDVKKALAEAQAKEKVKSEGEQALQRLKNSSYMRFGITDEG